ncbi:MAG: hypothetical protein IJ300_06945 [Clostridia bacterium]|nr:hypothetical protein [Clostridia bacterium]
MFEFNDNILKLSFPGVEFKISSIEGRKGIRKISDKAVKVEDEVLTGKRTIEKACEEFASDIDEMLGKGSCKKIFGERTVTYEDLADVIAYINYKCSEFLKSKANAYEQRNKRNKYPKDPVHKKGGKK